MSRDINKLEAWIVKTMRERPWLMWLLTFAVAGLICGLAFLVEWLTTGKI